ncbi:MAG: class I SAM-dependent methyltransferase [Candidatus Omnitrophota bacterium]
MEENYKCKVCGELDYETIVDNIKDWEYGYDGTFSYFQCKNCRLIQIHPFPDVKDLVNTYKVNYHGFIEPSKKGRLFLYLFNIVEALSLRYFKKELKVDSKILDVGCGIGILLSKLRSMGFSNIEGIDFSKKAYDSLLLKDIKCHFGTFLDFCGQERSYDLIIMNNYLEHCLAPMEELKKAKLLLKDSGLLIGEMPNFKSLDRVLFGRYWGGNHVPRHTFQFDSDKIAALLKNSGFSNIVIKYPLNTSHFSLSIQNFLQRHKNLQNNNLKYGRAIYYSFLMLMLIPINLLFVLTKRAGFLKFYARV